MHARAETGPDPSPLRCSLNSDAGAKGLTPSACLAYLRGVRALLPFARRLQTGRGWAHPTFTGKRPAPGRRAGWLELQGDRCVRYRRAPSNGAVAKRGLRSYPAKTRAPRRSSRSRVDKTAAMIEKSPSAGCRKAAVGAGDRPPEDRKILMEDRKVLLVAE